MRTPSLGRRFAHEPTLDICRGKIKVYCCCGAQSRRMFDDIADAIKAHATHVGLKELQKKELLA